MAMNKFQQVSALVTIPFVMALPPIAGWIIGRWLDQYFETVPYLQYIFLVFGVMAGARECYRIIKRFGMYE